METKVKNREWVKDAAIIFLVVLLILTFFSNTIMNRTLPEVATSQVSNGAIVAKVRGSGVVTANGKHQVKAKETRTIRAVMIKAGQEVNAGDVLFVLGEGDATALEQAQDTLRELQYSYQRSAVSIPNFDYSSYWRSINSAERKLQEAEKTRDEAKLDYDRVLGELKETRAEVDAKISAAEAELKAAEGALKTAETAYNTQTDKHDKLDTKIAEAVQDIKTIITRESEEAPDVDPVTPTSTPEPSETTQPTDPPGNNIDPDNTNADNSTQPQGTQENNNGEELNQNGSQNQQNQDSITNQQQIPIESTTPTDNNDPVVEADTISSKGESGYERVVQLVFSKEENNESDHNCPYMEKKRTGIILLKTAPEATDIETQMEAAIAQHVIDYGQKTVALANAETALVNAVAEHNTLVNSTEYNEAVNVYEATKDRYFRAIEMYDAAIPAEARPYKTKYDEAKNDVDAAAEDLQYAYDSLYSAQESNSKSASVSYIDLQQLAEKIRLQQEKIKSLAGDEENVITANVSGVVDTIDCTAGDTVLKDALMATIEVPDMGHTLSFSVTNDQAQRLRIGDTATISNYYWGNSITATLTSIRTDPKNPQSNKLLTFDLVGDVTTGSELTISVGQKSANYDLIVPNSAIKSDTNGSYVLVVTVKSSPLGNRYTARRVSVEVLANDDTNSAVVADLSNGDYVITTSSTPLNSGDMVRMADS